MRIHFFAPALALLASACAAGDAGIRDPDTFQKVALRTEVSSRQDYAELARCFEDRAALLPMTSFIADPSGPAITYRLRGFGFSFEEIRFAPASGGGSTATALLAPNLDGNWRRDFDADRLAPLRACADGSVS